MDFKKIVCLFFIIFKISLEFPPDLKYSHDSGLISLYDESDPNSVFEVQCIEPPTDEAVLGDLSSTYEYFIKDISESVTPSKPESFYIPEIDCNGLEFTLSGVSPNVSSNVSIINTILILLILCY